LCTRGDAQPLAIAQPAGPRFDVGMSDDPIPGNDSSEAYEVIPMPEHWRGPKGWWTVMRDGIPVRHFPKRAGANRYATDPAYRASLTEKKFWQDRD